MPNKEMQITFNVRVAWWLKWYIAGVLLMAYITKCQPNEERVSYWVRKAVTLTPA
jgi:hypothetical protein